MRSSRRPVASCAGSPNGPARYALVPAVTGAPWRESGELCCGWRQVPGWDDLRSDAGPLVARPLSSGATAQMRTAARLVTTSIRSTTAVHQHPPLCVDLLIRDTHVELCKRPYVVRQVRAESAKQSPRVRTSSHVLTAVGPGGRLASSAGDAPAEDCL